MPDILGGRLSLEDGYSSALQKFASGVLAAENKFKEFANSMTNSNQKIANEATKTSQQVDKIAQKFIQQGNTVADSINKANDKVKENQEKTIEGLSQKYIKLGMTIQDAYSKAKKDSDTIWNGESSNNGSSGGNELKDFAQSFLQSGFAGVIGKLGLIGTSIAAGLTVMKTLNNWMEQGFNVLNRVSDGLFSYEGIKEAITESMDFETGRMKLDLFYGSDSKGLDAYQKATYEANKTFASESDTIDIMSKMGQMGVSLSKDQLDKFLDVAGTRPEVETSHIGLAVKEALEGRINMLQMYGISNHTLKTYDDSLKKSDPNKYKELQGALSKKGTAGDPQKYVNLLTSYIEQSPMNGYAETYAKTVQGKLERLEGVWSKLKAEIMGIDTNTGIAKEGGVFAAVAKMVDDLKDKLEDTSTLIALQTIGNAFGNVFTSFSNSFSRALKPDTIDKVADSITKIGDALAKMINHFVDSGQLDMLITELPVIAEKVLGNEAINYTSKIKVGADIAQGNYSSAAEDWMEGKSDWVRNTFGINEEAGLLSGSSNFSDIQKAQNKNDGDWLKSKLGVSMYSDKDDNMFSNFSDWFEVKFGGAVNDEQLTSTIDKNDNLSNSEKNQLKNVINSDGKNIYHISINKIEANNFDEMMSSLEAAERNKK